MTVLKGIAASKGYVAGEAYCLKKPDLKIEKTAVKSSEEEITRLNEAIEMTAKALKDLYKKALEQVGEEAAAIFDAHSMMLLDEDYVSCITGIIESKNVCAEYAVLEASRQFEEILRDTGDDYMCERAADVRDICTKLVCQLTGQDNADLAAIDHPVIVVASELMPSDTINLDKKNVLAFVTGKGSNVSHSAILARGMGIPAVVGLSEGWEKIRSGNMITVNGCDGIVCINPDDTEYKKFISLQETYLREKENLLVLKDHESVSRDGVKIEICANIGSPDDVEIVLAQGADGIGLFRTEFLYMENSYFPTEEQQYKAYKETLQNMDGRRVIIRTLDLGADKQVPYFNLDKEENPAMGYRAIRICLKRPEIFKPQLRALLRASVFGRLGIMFPMITSVDEVLRIKEFVFEVQHELTNEGKAWSDKIEYGIMIETPAAVMISDMLAEHVDFFSIGTNDLTQYMLAVDRMNENVQSIYNSAHPAVLRAIKSVVQNAHAHGLWVGICGESAADTSLTADFLAIGIDELSVSPSSVLEVRRAVCDSVVKDVVLKY